MSDWYDYNPDTTILEGGGWLDEPSIPAGTGYVNSPVNSQRLGGQQKPLLNPWESNDWTPNFGLQDLPGYGVQGPRPTGLGPRQLAPTSPSRPAPNLGAPGTDLYNRYKGLLMDPSSMGNDPAYQFLFNSGMQALNRTAAANRMRFSGKSLNDATKFGQGMAYDYMNRMLPQYKTGADEELQRWIAPSELSLRQYGLEQGNVGLAQRGTAQNNELRGEVEGSQAAQDLIPMMSDTYRNMAGLNQPQWTGINSYDSPAYGGIGYTRRLGSA